MAAAGNKRGFVLQNSDVDIHEPARRHGVDDDGIRHAIIHALTVEDVGEDPDR